MKRKEKPKKKTYKEETRKKKQNPKRSLRYGYK